MGVQNGLGVFFFWWGGGWFLMLLSVFFFPLNVANIFDFSTTRSLVELF